MVWEKAEFEIATVNGKIPVKGYVLKDQGVCVHRDLNEPRYWIHTHLKSGYSICHFKYATLEKAKKYAEKMAATEIDWHATQEALSAKYTDDEFRKIVNEAYFGEKKDENTQQ